MYGVWYSMLSMAGYLLSFLIVFTVFAEQEVSVYGGCDQENAPYFVVQSGDSLSVYALTDEQDLERIWMLPAQFRPFRYKDNENLDDVWFIPHVNDVVQSPDGCYIAFTAAQHPEREFSNRQLFVYSLTSDDLKQLNIAPQIDVDSPNLIWSPDGASLAIAIEAGDIYLYEVADDSLTRLAQTETTAYFLELQWIENEFIAFVQTEANVGNIYLRSLDGNVHRKLTHFEEMEIPNLITWNARSQRLFYATGGLSTTNQVFSVDLEGDNQLELDLAEFSPSEAVTRVVGLVVEEASGDVYVFTKQTGTENNTDRIFQITSNGEINVFWEASSSNYAVVAPTGDALAILFTVTATEKQIQLITLSSIETSTILNGNLCNFGYIDAYRIVYTVSDTFCWNGDAGNRELWLLNTVSGDKIILTSGLAHPIWIMPHTVPRISWEVEQMTWMLDME